MAKQPRQKKASQDLLERALQTVAAEGWAGVTLADMAARSGTPVVEYYRRFGSKYGVIGALVAQVDEAMLSVEDPDLLEQPPRDRLFELLMRRFEALMPHKAALRTVLRDGAADPILLLQGRRSLLNSMAWALEAAGLSASGLRGLVRVRALAAIYLAALRVWFTEDSPDMARTMAELDKRLRQAERLSAFVGRRAVHPSRPPAAAPEAS